MNKKISTESKLKLLDLLKEELEVRNATIGNLLRNIQNEKAKYYSRLDSGEDVSVVLDNCERSLRRFSLRRNSIEQCLEELKIWSLELIESEKIARLST
jgi:transcriptional antiterminator